MTLEHQINEAKAAILKANPLPPQPDFTLDLDVKRYNSEVEVIHRLMADAEQLVRDTYVAPKKKGGKNGPTI